MWFVYDQMNDGDEDLNFIETNSLLKSGLPRFSPSPLVLTLKSYVFRSRKINDWVTKANIKHTTIIPDNCDYIISSGVNHGPNDWCVYDQRNLFDCLTITQIQHLQESRAFLLLDQSHEGYQVTWLWDWFHDSLKKYNINPERILYITGNLNSSNDYDVWCNTAGVKSKMCVIPYPHFEQVIGVIAMNYENPCIDMPRSLEKMPDFVSQIHYKKNNIDNIKTFNLLQKRPRGHRIAMFNALYENNLMQNNIVSMGEIPNQKIYYDTIVIQEDTAKMLSEMTPIIPPSNPTDSTESDFISGNCGDYLRFLNEQIIMDTWISVISEASFADSEGTCFLSEKTFKPIACMHPFIIFGNKGSLSHLRNLGYKTFAPFINEEYDDLPTWERFNAIINEMKRLTNLSSQEKLEMYENLKDTLIHNFNVLIRNSHRQISPSIQTLYNYYNVHRTS